MTPELLDLYQEIILQHHKHPHHYGPLGGRTHVGEGRNPQCGDEIQVNLRLENGRIAEVSFEGEGCAVSRASGSILTDAVTGKTPDEAVEIARQIKLWLESPQEPNVDRRAIGDVAALLGVRKHPARFRCAYLAWEALQQALGKV